MSYFDLTEFENFVTNILPGASDIVKRYFRTENLGLSMKDRDEVVTEADLAVNDFISSKINLEYPEIAVLSEESPKKSYDYYRGQELLWVIDPIDGTGNFSRGVDYFGICIALCQKGKPVLGVVHSPIRAETYKARRDKEGAFLNDEEINVKEAMSLKGASIAVDFGYNKNERQQISNFISKIISETYSIYSLGSASLAMCEVGAGIRDGYLALGLSPWDFAASSYICEKAGAKVTTADGSPLDIFNPTIILSAPGIHKKMMGKMGRE